MAQPLKLDILLGAIDKATAPLNRINTSATRTAEQLRHLKEQERALKAVQQDISGYRMARIQLRQQSRQLKRATGLMAQHRLQLDAARHAQHANNHQVKRAQQEYQRLSNKLFNSREANHHLINALEKARVQLEAVQQNTQRNTKEVTQWAQQVKKAEGEQQRLASRTAKLTQDVTIYGQRLGRAGIHTDHLTGVTHRLIQGEDQLTLAIAKQQQQLEKLSEIQSKVNNARSEHARGMNARSTLALTGAGAIANAERIFHLFKSPVEESKRYQSELARLDALGQGPEITEAARQFIHSHPGYGVSENDSLILMRDALSVFGHEAHTEIVTPILQKMQFANRARYGEEHSENNERLFIEMLKAIELRGGINDPASFERQANKVQQVINATGGRVNADEWMHLIKTGGIAVKGLSDDAFYYKLEPLVQEMGGDRVGTGLMSAYQNLYQGRTTKAAAKQLEALGLIGDKSKVTYDTVGQEAYVGPGALKGGELFKQDIFAWVDTLLLPQLAKAGITSQQQILDAVGSILTNRTGAAIISGYIQQQTASQRRAELNARADGIDQMYLKARQQVQGKELELAARRTDLYKTLGDTLLPAYTEALEKATQAIQMLHHWMQQHPKAAKLMLVSLAGFGVLIGLFGTLSLSLAALLGPLVMVRYALHLVGLRFSKVTSSNRKAARAMNSTGRHLARFARPLAYVKTLLKNLRPIIVRVALLLSRLLVSALMNVGRALLFLSAASPLLTAIGLIIIGLAYAAYKIYTHWEPIKGFFIQLWDTVLRIFQQAIDTLKGLWPSLMTKLNTFWHELKTTCFTWAKQIVEFLQKVPLFSGLIEGCKAAFESLKNALTGHALPAIVKATTYLWQQLSTVFNTGITQLSALILTWQPWAIFHQLFVQIITLLREKIPGLFHESGLRMMHALGNGIMAGISFVKEKLRSIKHWLTQWMPFGNDASPSIQRRPTETQPPFIFKEAAKSIALTGLLATPAMAQVNTPFVDSTPLAQVIQRQVIQQQTPLPSQGKTAPSPVAHLPRLPAQTPWPSRVPSPIEPLALTPLPHVTFDRQPALSAPSMPAAHTDQRQFTINIHPTPGMDPHAIADAVRQELNRRDHEQQAYARSSLYDRG